MIDVNVYMQDGRVFTYQVSDAIKAREHAHRIVNYGWRNAINGVMEYYPVHQVLKVTWPASADYMSSKYKGQKPSTNKKSEPCPVCGYGFVNI
jgi:hypothetical protein